MKTATIFFALIFCVMALSAFTADQETNAGTSNDTVQPPTKKGKLARQQGPDGQQRGDLAKQLLRDLPPDDVERLRKLKADSPEEFKKEMKRLTAKNKGKQQGGFPPEDTQELKQLVKDFKDTQDPAQREQLKSKIKDEVKNIFEKRMADNKEQLDKAEQRLAKLKELYEKRKTNADAIIEERVRSLTVDKESKRDKTPTPSTSADSESK